MITIIFQFTSIKLLLKLNLTLHDTNLMLMHPGLTLTHPGLHMVAFDLSFAYVQASSKHAQLLTSFIEIRQHYQQMLVPYFREGGGGGFPRHPPML